MSLPPTIIARTESLARILYPDHPAMRAALCAVIEGLCTIAWCRGFRAAAEQTEPPPTAEVEAIANLAIKRAQSDSF